MTTTMKRLTSVFGAMLASALLFVAVATPSRAATGSANSVDALAAADGLVLVPDSTMAQAWVKPGVDLHAYSGVLVRPARFRYRETPRVGDGAYPVTDAQKKALEEMIPDEVVAELADKGHLDLTFEPGARVLALEIAVVDIVSHIPPGPAARGATFVRTLGAATLAVELRDSVTGEVVARAIERREIVPRTVHRSNRAWNHTEVRRAAERFGVSVRKQVEEFTKL